MPTTLEGEVQLHRLIIIGEGEVQFNHIGITYHVGTNPAEPAVTIIVLDAYRLFTIFSL